jgi:hypothetical protein
MPNFCSSSNPAKPILVRLSVIHSLKKHPHSYAKIVKSKRKEIVPLNLDLSFISGFVLGCQSGLIRLG